MKLKKVLLSLAFIMLFSILWMGTSVMASNETYVGDINTELKHIRLGKSGENSYISGEIIVVEWVNGKSTVPRQTPEIRFKSTDNFENGKAFVTPTGTNTYYFDIFLEGVDTSKEYYFEVISGSKNNTSKNYKMKVDFTNTEYNNKILGNFHEKKIRIKEQSITFEYRTDTYVGHINSEIKTFNLGKTGDPMYYIGDAYVSGEIVVVEWVDDKSTVPVEKPIMKFKSTDGEVELEVFVTATGTNTYYFDRYIEGIDTSKEYYFEISSGNKLNISLNKSMNVYFSGTKYNNTVIGNYHTWNVRLINQKIKFEDAKYIGNINSELKKIETLKTGYWKNYIAGEIVIVEWVNGISTVPEVTPKMKLKSTDGQITLDMFVTPTGTNTYYFDRIISGIPTDKEYYIEIISNDERNVSTNKSMILDFTRTQFNDSIIGLYTYEQISKQLRVVGQNIKFEDYIYENPYENEDENRNIYITRTGKKYHYDSTCNGGTYILSTLQEALSRGLTPCEKCVN